MEGGLEVPRRESDHHVIRDGANLEGKKKTEDEILLLGNEREMREEEKSKTVQLENGKILKYKKKH